MKQLYQEYETPLLEVLLLGNENSLCQTSDWSDGSMPDSTENWNDWGTI